jgi:predicted GNAT superfamily acetyltransferase
MVSGCSRQRRVEAGADSRLVKDVPPPPGGQPPAGYAKIHAMKLPDPPAAEPGLATTGEVTLRVLDGAADFRACYELQRLTWGRDFEGAVPPSVLKIIARAGGVVAGAFAAAGPAAAGSPASPGAGGSSTAAASGGSAGAAGFAEATGNAADGSAAAVGASSRDGAADSTGADSHLVGFVLGLTGVRPAVGPSLPSPAFPGAAAPPAGTSAAPPRPEVFHWSHMLAVHPSVRDLGLGRRLKAFQRELLLSIGVTTMEWTFDPLEARNANLNLNILRAEVAEYVEDMYKGEEGSELARGIGTDRFIVSWRPTVAGGQRTPSTSVSPVLHRSPLPTWPPREDRRCLTSGGSPWRYRRASRSSRRPTRRVRWPGGSAPGGPSRPSSAAAIE